MRRQKDPARAMDARWMAPTANQRPPKGPLTWSGRRDSNPRPQPWQGADQGLCRNSQSAGLRLRPPSFQEIHRIMPCCRAVYSESGASLPPWRTDPEDTSCTVGSDHRFELIVSPLLVAELDDVLSREKFADRVGQSERLTSLSSHCYVTKPEWSPNLSSGSTAHCRSRR